MNSPSRWCIHCFRYHHSNTCPRKGEMSVYKVECQGRVREVYLVEADSPEEARKNWDEGELLISEAYDVGPESVELDDE